jgi:hypothetical protein
MVRVVVGKADLYVLYFPKSSGLSFQVCFATSFLSRFYLQAPPHWPVNGFKVILERYLIGVSPTTLSSSATTISSSATAAFGARASLIHINSSSFELFAI